MFQKIDPKTLDENVFSLIHDKWMLVSAGTADRCNTMTASWGGLGILWNRCVATCYIRPQRYTREFMEAEDCFTLAFFGEEHRKALAYCGANSGRDVDKFAQCHLTPEPAQTVKAPLIAECPVSLECRVTATKELGTHTVFEAEITGVNVEEQFLDSKGKLNLQQCGLIAYAHCEYFALGRKLGNFGDSVRKKKKKRPEHKKQKPQK